MVKVNKEILRDEIHSLLEAINEQYREMNAYETKIPQIEFDIIMENIRKLYQDLLLLQRAGDQVDPVRPKDKEQVKKITPDDTGDAEEEVPRPKPAKPEKKISERKPPEINLFTDESSEFSEKLKEARATTLGLKTGNAHSSDLKSLITINEKFLFINELFDGNLRDYNEAVETLSKCADLNTATGFLDQMRRNNRWNSESDAFRKLNELVERKFV